MSATNRNGLARHEDDFYETPPDAIDVVLHELGITSAFEGYVVDAGSGTGAIAQRVALLAPRADVRGVEKNPEHVAKARAARSSTIAFDCADWLEWQPDGTPDLVIGNPPYQDMRFNPDKILAKDWKKTANGLAYVSGDYTINISKGANTVFHKLEPIGTCTTIKAAKAVAEFHDPVRGGWEVVDDELAEKFIRKALAIAGKKGTVAMLLRDNYMIPKTRRALRTEFGKPDTLALERRPSFNGSGTDATDYAWHVWGPKRGGKWTVLEAPASRRA